MKSWIWLVAFSLLTSGIASDSRAQEGIRVHGEWTVVIRDADGHILKRQQFSNDLVKCPPCGPFTGGKLLLTALRIVKSRAPINFTSMWRINLFVGATKLSLEEATLGPATDTISTNLVDQYPNAFVADDPAVLTLAGSIRTPVGGTLTKVETGFVTWSDGNPRDRASASEGIFTQTVPNPTITVTAGQLLDVKVVISFL